MLPSGLFILSLPRSCVRVSICQRIDDRCAATHILPSLRLLKRRPAKMSLSCRSPVARATTIRVQMSSLLCASRLPLLCPPRPLHITGTVSGDLITRCSLAQITSSWPSVPSGRDTVVRSKRRRQTMGRMCGKCLTTHSERTRRARSQTLRSPPCTTPSRRPPWARSKAPWCRGT